MYSKRKMILMNIFFGLIFVVILLITIQLNKFELLGIISNLEIKDLIAVLGIGAFVMGTSFMFGVKLRQIQNYHLKSSKYSIKFQISILGGMYVLNIIYTILVVFHDIRALLFLSLLILLGLQGYTFPVIYQTVTLKMVTFNEQGSKKIETRNNLELYDTTDKDYRFKDMDGDEFIVPNNQVLEIIYLDNPIRLKKDNN